MKKTLYHPGDDVEYQPKSHHSNGVRFPVQQPHRYSTIGTQSEFEAPLQVIIIIALMTVVTKTIVDSTLFIFV